MPERWQGWLLTGEAMIELSLARLIIVAVPLRHWGRWFGQRHRSGQSRSSDVRILARHLQRAAQRLPFESKCLPRAMALGRMLGRRGIAHHMVIGARPAQQRKGTDDLHAWIEVDGTVILGELPGPWAIIHRLPSDSM